MSVESLSQLESSEPAPGEGFEGDFLLPTVDLGDLPLPYEEEAAPEPTRTDRTDDAGQIIGYSLITVYPWGARVQDDYDLNGDLIATSYSDDSGNTSASAWETIVDDNGEITGRRYSYKSSSGSYSYSSVDVYAPDGSLVASESSSSEGDWSRTERVDPPAGVEAGPIPLSYALLTSGAWADGTTYETTQVFNQNGVLVSSESHYSDGSSDQYLLSPKYADNGTLIGYQGEWTWTDANGEVSTSDWMQEFDAEMNDISSIERGGGIHVMTMDLTGGTIKTLRGEADAGDAVTSGSEDIRLNSSSHSGITHATLLGHNDLNLWGNELANVLDGNAGDNRIYGGLNKDVLSGGRGEDAFIFKAVRKSRDTITDFDPSQDKLALKGEDFASLFSQGNLRSDVIGKVLLFDPETEKLLFAPQGEREGERPIILAVLPGFHPADLKADLFVQA